MKLTAMIVAALTAYLLGMFSLALPYGLWVLVWAVLIGLLILLGRWVADG